MRRDEMTKLLCSSNTVIVHEITSAAFKIKKLG